ncbi:unnamed protein product [Triticum aestivum]|uniref:DUF7597 domain-containing protein n=1 Tax=Triticum aestivum TaxID=4565 RepID=A0A7H4LFW7_WHEAT|nr:unnamed protein product [Triticum aestivum]
MANFPFDPLPFLPFGYQPLQVEGRPARVRVVCGHIHRKNENLAMATIIPMPAGEVHFANVREILSEFLTTHKRLGFQKISKCPLGQAFVQLHSVFDRDELVLQNLRNFADIRNAVKSFSTFMEWDQQLSSDAGILVKIRVEELRDIPSSILLTGSNEFRGDSWSCPVSILQQRLIEQGPADEEPVPLDGNPHPIPQQPHFHPNQHHFFGPINQHQQEENNDDQDNQAEEQNHNQVNLDLNLVDVPVHLAQDFHPWGPQENIDLNIDLELHQGGFMQMHDLMEPCDDMQQPQAELPIMDDNSDITLSFGSNDSEATQDAEPDFLDSVDLSSQNQEFNRQLLAKELFDEFANPSLGLTVVARRTLIDDGIEKDVLTSPDKSVPKDIHNIETVESEKEHLPVHVPVAYHEDLDISLTEQVAVPQDSATSGSMGPPPGYDTKAIIHGAATDSKIVKSPQEEHHCLGGESAKLWAAHFAPKNESDKVTQGILGGEDSVEPSFSTPQSKTSSSLAPVLEDHASTTSALHSLKKRKDRAPVVETEVDAKEVTEETLNKQKNKRGTKVETSKEGQKEAPKAKAIFKP